MKKFKYQKRWNTNLNAKNLQKPQMLYCIKKTQNLNKKIEEHNLKVKKEREQEKMRKEKENSQLNMDIEEQQNANIIIEKNS